MGSTLEVPAINEFARKFDFIHTATYGKDFLTEDEVQAKLILWTDPWSSTRWFPRDHQIYPSPSQLPPKIRGKHKHLWDPRHPEWASYVYPFCQEWIDLFCEGVIAYIKKARPLAILLDNHRPTHGWWVISEEGLAYSHPGSREDRIKLLIQIEERLRLELEKYGGSLITNGQPLLEGTLRFWEGVGQSYNPIDEVYRNAKPGDHLYVNSGQELHWKKAQFMGFRKKAAVGCGRPDGAPLISEVGAITIPPPEDWWGFKKESNANRS